MRLHGLIAVVGLLVGLLVGLALHSMWDNHRVAEIENAHAKVVRTATEAKDKAEAKNKALEKKIGEVQATAATEYEKGRLYEKGLTDRTIADLRNDVVRLRVRTNRRPAGSCAVPDPAAAAGSGDGEATETLSGPVAARLAGRYADYNGLVDQLGLCQQTVEADRLQ